MSLSAWTPLERLGQDGGQALAELRRVLGAAPSAPVDEAFQRVCEAAGAVLATPAGRTLFEWLADQTLRAPPVAAPPGATLEQTTVQVLQWQARAGLVQRLLMMADQPAT